MKNGMSGAAAGAVAMLTLVIGFGMGMLFGGDDVAAPALSPGGGRVERYEASTGTARDASMPVRNAISSATAQPASFRVSDTQIEQATADLEVTSSDPVTGTEQITGRVGTMLGEPLAGAVIVATLRSNSDPYGNSTAELGSGRVSDRSLKETLRAEADQWAGNQGRRYRGVSGNDGSYVLEGLPAGRYTLSAYHEGFVVSRAEGSYYVDAGGSQDFTARPVVALHAEVRLPDGSSPDLAAIRIQRGRDTNTARWTAEDPVIRVAEAEGTAVAMTDFITEGGFGSGAPPRLRSQEVQLHDATDRLVFELAPTQGVYGRIRGNRSGMSYEIRLLDLSRDPDDSDEAFKRSTRRERASDSSYSFLDLDAGTYVVGLVGRNDAVLARSTCRVTDGLVACDLEIPEPSADDSVRVLCLSPDGFPLHDVSFDYRMMSNRGGGGGSVRSTERDADGAYWLPAASMNVKDFGNLAPEAALQITGTHPHFGRSIGTLTGAQKELTLQFQEPCRLTVTVPGYAQSPLRGSLRAHVMQVDDQPASPGLSDLVARHGRALHNEQQTLGPDGSVTFTKLTPGSWQVQLLLSNNEWGGRMVAETKLELTAREHEISLPIPALHRLVISAPGLEPGAHLWISKKREDDAGPAMYFGGSQLNGQLDDQRQFIAENVAAGTYMVHANGMMKQTEIVVPGGPFVLEAAKFDCVKVSISDVDGALYRAGLRPGDLVVEINGRGFDAGTWWQVLQEEGSKQNVPLTLLRNGERITVQGGDFTWQGEDAGGSFAPASTTGD